MQPPLSPAADGTLPRYEHDCPRCRWLGQHGEADLYFCPGSLANATVVARKSSDGPDYSSGMSFGYGLNPELSEARRRAQRAGLCRYDVLEALRLTRKDMPGEYLAELAAELAASELGRALTLFGRDAEAGSQALVRWMREQTRACAAHWPGASRLQCEGDTRGHVERALFWSQHFGTCQASAQALRTVLYGAELAPETPA